MIQTLVTFEQDCHSIDYIPPYLTRDIYLLSVDILSRDWTDTQRIAAIAAWCAEFTEGLDTNSLLVEHPQVLIPLAFHMMAQAGFVADERNEIEQLLNIGTGGDEYDDTKDDPVCTCVKCMGLIDDGTNCKFTGITKMSTDVVEWTHLAKNPDLLDAPYSLYQLSRMKARADSAGQAARRQERDNERKEKKNAKSIRNKYGHNW